MRLESAVVCQAVNIKDHVYNMENGGHPAWDVCCTGLMIDMHEYVGYVDINVYIDRLWTIWCGKYNAME